VRSISVDEKVSVLYYKPTSHLAPGLGFIQVFTLEMLFPSSFNGDSVMKTFFFLGP